MLELLKTESLDAITVTGIIEHAGYSRSAFYNNYIDVRDCMDSIIDQQADLLFQAIYEHGQKAISNFGEITNARGNIYELWFRAPYEVVYANKEFYLILCTKLPESVLYSFIYKVTTKLNVSERFEAQGFDAEIVNTELWMWSHLWDTMGRVIYWINHGMIYSPEYMGRQQYLKRIDGTFLNTKS